MPSTSESAMESPLVVFFSRDDCSRCSGLMRFCAKPMTTAESAASTGMIQESPPSSAGTIPRNSVPGAPWSVMPWMTSTRPKSTSTCTASGTRERSG